MQNDCDLDWLTIGVDYTEDELETIAQFSDIIDDFYSTVDFDW